MINNKITIEPVEPNGWNNEFIIPRYSIAILDAIKEKRFFSCDDKYVIVSKDIADSIKAETKPIFYNGIENIAYDQITVDAVNLIKNQYNDIKDKIIQELTNKRVIKNGEVEEVEEKLNIAIKNASLASPKALPKDYNDIYAVYKKHEKELPKFGTKIGFDAVSAFEELMTVKGKTIETINKIPDDLHHTVLNSLSSEHLTNNILKDILETVKIQKKIGFSISQIKTICDHLAEKKLLTLEEEDKFYDDSKSEENKNIQSNVIVAKVGALLENIKNIKFPVPDSKNVKKEGTKNIVLPYVGAGRPAMVFQNPKENDSYFSAIGEKSINNTANTGLEGNGLFYNGPTKAVDCLLVIKMEDGSLKTIVAKRPNAEGWALYGGIHSSLKNQKDTAFETMVKELLEETGNHPSQVKKKDNETDEAFNNRKNKQQELEKGVKSLFKKLATLDGSGQNADPRKTNTASMSTTMFSILIDAGNVEEMKKLHKLDGGEISALNWIKDDLMKGKTKENDEMTATKTIEIVNKKGEPETIDKLFAGHHEQIKEIMPIILFKDMFLHNSIENNKAVRKRDQKGLCDKTLRDFKDKYDTNTGVINILQRFIDTELNKGNYKKPEDKNRTLASQSKAIDRLSRPKTSPVNGRY